MKFTIIGLLIPFIGTLLGAMTVLIVRNEISDKLQKALGGFAAGVMIAATVWSLLIPSIEMAEKQGDIAWLPAAVGFLAGIAFLLLLDMVIPHIHAYSNVQEGPNTEFHRTTMLVLAVTLHNIPEGMAVGAVFAGLLAENVLVTLSGAFALSVGIAIQNFPEGAIVSMPLLAEGASRKKAFWLGTISGAVEPIAAIITIALTSFITGVMPYLLSFAAGAMIYVVVEELIPESQHGEHTNWGTIGVGLGFAIMMVLDVALG